MATPIENALTVVESETGLTRPAITEGGLMSYAPKQSATLASAWPKFPLISPLSQAKPRRKESLVDASIASAVHVRTASGERVLGAQTNDEWPIRPPWFKLSVCDPCGEHFCSLGVHCCAARPCETCRRAFLMCGMRTSMLRKLKYAVRRDYFIVLGADDSPFTKL